MDPKIAATGSGTPHGIHAQDLHRSTGKDKRAAETVAGVLLGTGWTCNQCSAAYIGTPPEGGLCQACKAN